MKDDISKLYHYTKIRNIVSILKSKKLWLNDLNFMDDPTDRAYGCLYTIKSIHESELDKVKKIRNNMDDVFIIGEFMKEFETRYYAMSFSLKYDNRKMWNDYAKCSSDNCLGTCIYKTDYIDCKYKNGCMVEFDGNVLNEKVSKYQHFTIRNVLYDNKTSSRFDEIADVILNEDVDEDLMSSKRICNDLIQLIEAVTEGVVKDEAKWGHQKEYRALYKEKEPILNVRKRIPLLSDKRNRKFNGHYEIGIEDELRDGLIKKIVLCDDDFYGKTAVEKCIKDQGLNNIEVLFYSDFCKLQNN